MKIAVTGASGFIGRHVLNELLSNGINVVAITRDTNNLKDYAQLVKLVQLDIADSHEDVFDLIGRPDALIHLAWNGLPNYKSLHHFESELPSQYKFLNKLICNGLGSLVVTGTCFEYGMQSGALREDNLTNPSNPYGYAKDSLRKQLEFLKFYKPFNLTWTRLFYMYGDDQPKNSLYPQLKDAVLRGDKEFNMSGGEQLRDYLPVTTVAKKIVSLALVASDAGIVNLSSGKPIKIKDLVEKWLIEHGWNLQLNLGFYPYPDYEPMAFWGDNSRLEEVLRNQ